MRLCQVMLSPGFGGAERYFLDLCHGLAAAGHDVLAVCRAGSAAAGRLQAGARLRVAQVPVWGAWDLRVAWRLSPLLEDFRPQLVETHLARAARLAGLAARRARVPLTARIHNYVNLKYYGDVDLFLACTDDLAGYLADRGVGAERITVVPNFSAVAPCAQVPRASRGAPIAALGRLVPEKGFDVLLQALARLRDGGVQARLAIGGAGPARESLHRLAGDLGLQGQVTFRGWQEDAGAFLDGAALFVLPSRREAFGIVLLEAMARGIPIVATATPGPRAVLGEQCAWLVEPDDVNALARALGEALADENGRRARAEAALSRYRERYTAGVVMPRLLEIYARLVSAHGERD